MDTNQKEEAPILMRNKDVEHIVNAAANLGHYAGAKPVDQRLALLITTDVHCDRKRLKSAVDYLNGMEALDAGICLGDVQSSNFTQNDGVWYTDIVNQASKPFYTVIGNHDGGNSTKASLCGTKKQVFDKFIAPTMERIGIAGLDRTYYAVTFEEYKITLIVLDNYDVPDDREESGDFAISRSVDRIGQEQADWLVDTLMQVPTDHHVLITRHSYPDRVMPIPCTWTIPNQQIEDNDRGNLTCHLVEDIVNAWMNGSAMEKEYVPGDDFHPEAWMKSSALTKCYMPNFEHSVLSPVKVKADFKSRGQGTFIGYLVGHQHWDWQGHSLRYPKQRVYCFQATVNDMWQNYASDLPRLEGTKAEDSITVFTVDRKYRRVCLVRVGSNVTNTMTDRTYISFTY